MATIDITLELAAIADTRHQEWYYRAHSAKYGILYTKY